MLGPEGSDGGGLDPSRPAGRPTPCQRLAFGRVSPMQAQTAPTPFDGPDWLFEVKWDGYRAIAFLENARSGRGSATAGPGTLLQSRRLRDLTPSYPELGRLHARLDAWRAVVDGEIVALRDGRPDFQTLQRGGGPAVYVVFDLLELDGVSLLSHPLGERKGLLGQRLHFGPDLLLSETVRGAGIDFHGAAVAQGLEGTLAKREGSLYRPGRRTSDWLKVRNVRRVFALACGHTQAADARPLGALVLGAFDPKGRLVYAGHAGTGFDSREAAALVRALGPAAPCPLAGGEPRELRGRVTWVRPGPVVEVECLEWTREGRLRHPVYRGLRPDKDGGDCRAPAGGDP